MGSFLTESISVQATGMTIKKTNIDANIYFTEINKRDQW
jgi:hypothetical protein